ncbi:MAG: hypothetical protein M0D57_11125 [Sphingobacteriales bacterium JAD_PAG50586_3]|nr:MAG: hypothetical protein M0D57_11125 [Sphingobacteriales bacterium JAD_PAG50586_3]
MSKRIHHIKSDIAIGVGFLVFMLFGALLLKVWLILEALIVTILFLLLLAFIFIRIAKTVNFYNDYLEEVNVFGKVKIVQYVDIQRIEIYNLSYKDSGKNFLVYIGNRKLRFVERDKANYFFLLNFLKDRKIDVREV